MRRNVDIGENDAVSRPSLRSPLPIVSFVFFIMIATVSLNPTLLRFPLDDLDMLNKTFTRTADRAWYPDYPAFLDDVRAVTKNGDSIAIAVPTTGWWDGYAYAYYRASYFLAGREVLPLVTPESKLIPANLSRAKYVAAWHAGVRGKWRLAMSSRHHGVLLVN